MASELAPIDIRHMPELTKLVEEARATGKPRRLMRDNEDVAVLVPVASTRHRPARSRPARPRTSSITNETAGIFKDYRLPRPLTPREERETFEQGVADEVAGKRDG
jgi:hypothetical protein